MRRQLPFDLLPRDLLEESRVEVSCVVDEHVDASEPIDRSPHRRSATGDSSDVELDDEEILVLADGSGYAVELRPVATTA